MSPAAGCGHLCPSVCAVYYNNGRIKTADRTIGCIKYESNIAIRRQPVTADRLAVHYRINIVLKIATRRTIPRDLPHYRAWRRFPVGSVPDFFLHFLSAAASSVPLSSSARNHSDKRRPTCSSWNQLTPQCRLNSYGILQMSRWKRSIGMLYTATTVFVRKLQ